MRQRFDDPVFNFTNSAFVTNSVNSAQNSAATTANTASSSAVMVNASSYATLVQTVNQLVAQMQTMRIIGFN